MEIVAKKQMVYPRKVFTPKTFFSNRRIVIFIPSTEKDKRVSRKVFLKRINQTKKFLTRKFGGTTRFRAIGSFEMKINRKSKIVEEPIVEVESFVPEKAMTMSNRMALKDFLKDKAKEWKQVSLSAKLESPETVGEELHFFSGEED